MNEHGEFALRGNGLGIELRSSSKRVGKLYPILVDKHGNIIDGEHRFAVDRNWPRLTLDHIESEEQRLMAKLVSNVCRRKVSKGEKSRLLKELGTVYLKEGIKPGKIPQKLATETGMSYRWVMKYLPDDLKTRPGIGGPNSRSNSGNLEKLQNGVAHHATELDHLLLEDPRERILTIKDYANTDFVHVVLEKEFFMKVERLAADIGVGADALIGSILFSTVRKLERTMGKTPVSIPAGDELATVPSK